MVVMLIILFSVLLHHLFESQAVGIVSAVVMCASLRRYFFATHYELSGAGVVIHPPFGFSRRLAWADIRRVRIGGHAAWVSPAAKPGWLDHRRGILLLFGPHRAEVMGFIQQHLPELLERPAVR
jgi:hypothetical protein